MNRNTGMYGLSVIVLLSILAIAMPVSAHPTADNISVNNASGAQGTHVIVPVSIANTSNGPIYGIEFQITYNRSVINIIDITDVTKGTLTADWGLLVNNSHTWGTKVALAYHSSLSTPLPDGSSGSVALLNFSVVGNLSEISNMNLNSIVLSDGGGDEGTAPPENGTFTVSGTQSWYLHNDSEMYKGDQTKPEGNITINHNDSHIWIADSVAQTDVTFPVNGNNWTGQITFVSVPATGDIFKVEMGYSSGGTDFTTGGPQATLIGDGSKSVFSFETAAATFTVPAGTYLALNLTNENTSFDYKVQTGMTWSYISSPKTYPGYPIPEWSTLTLISVGLLILTGYLWLRRKK